MLNVFTIYFWKGFAALEVMTKQIPYRALLGFYVEKIDRNIYVSVLWRNFVFPYGK